MADILSALKGQQWERAKGEMNAMLAIIDSQPAQYEAKSGAHIPGKGLQFARELEHFVRAIEENGLHE